MTRPFATPLLCLFLALALAAPAAALASDMRPLPPVPSSRDKMTTGTRSGQSLGKALNAGATTKTGAKSDKLVRGVNGSTLTIKTNTPASLQ